MRKIVAAAATTVAAAALMLLPATNAGAATTFKPVVKAPITATIACGGCNVGF